MRKAKFFTYDGKTLTLREWSKETGISQQVLANRVYGLKWGIERALTEPVRNHGMKFRYKERELTLREWSKESGVPENVLYGRIVGGGWSMKDALEGKSDQGSYGGKLYEYEGKRLTLREWSELKGIPFETLAYRVRRSKMSIREAIERPVRSLGKLYRIGERELTLKEWSVAYGVEYSLLYARVVRKGMDIVDAIDDLLKKEDKKE